MLQSNYPCIMHAFREINQYFLKPQILQSILDLTINYLEFNIFAMSHIPIYHLHFWKKFLQLFDGPFSPQSALQFVFCDKYVHKSTVWLENPFMRCSGGPQNKRLIYIMGRAVDDKGNWRCKTACSMFSYMNS